MSRKTPVSLLLLSLASLPIPAMSHELGHPHGHEDGQAVRAEPSHHHHSTHAMQSGHAMQSMAPAMANDPHAAHMKMVEDLGDAYRRSVHEYQVPPVALFDAKDASLTLEQLLASDQPVVLNFIYTSCPTVCPVLSATFAEAQPGLMKQQRKPLMVSVSIDPAFDTPERLRNYASNYRADSNWHFFRGDAEATRQFQSAFDAFRGDKSNHIPLTFLRTAANSPWVRLEGFTSAADLVDEYARLVAH